MLVALTVAVVASIRRRGHRGAFGLLERERPESEVGASKTAEAMTAGTRASPK